MRSRKMPIKRLTKDAPPKIMAAAVIEVVVVESGFFNIYIYSSPYEGEAQEGVAGFP